MARSTREEVHNKGSVDANDVTSEETRKAMDDSRNSSHSLLLFPFDWAKKSDDTLLELQHTVPEEHCQWQ